MPHLVGPIHHLHSFLSLGTTRTRTRPQDSNDRHRPHAGVSAPQRRKRRAASPAASLDQTGAVLPGVTIDLVINASELTTTTDDEGQYRFEAVPSGSAELTYRLLNFNVLRRTVNVTSGGSVTQDVVLTLSLSADVVVTGTRTFRNIADVENPAENLVGIASAASQGAITAAQLEARPVMRAGEVLETRAGHDRQPAQRRR